MRVTRCVDIAGCGRAACAEDRQVVNGTVCKIRDEDCWRDLPERYGPRKTVHTRFRHALDGVFVGALRQIQAEADAAGDIEWLVQIGSTIRPCPRVRRRHRAKGAAVGEDGVDDYASLDRSRGGLTATLHLACDGKGRPLAILVPPGQRGISWSGSVRDVLELRSPVPAGE
ncbi:transposase [Streptomyces chartreusis]|uniref:transposase n=1 Tax=Streptomyces chartreusis TaxID=1969 RepID=UPI0037F4F359